MYIMRVYARVYTCNVSVTYPSDIRRLIQLLIATQVSISYQEAQLEMADIRLKNLFDTNLGLARTSWVYRNFNAESLNRRNLILINDDCAIRRLASSVCSWSS